MAYLELAPTTVLEIGTVPMETLWMRGGFPDSVLATSTPRVYVRDSGLVHALRGGAEIDLLLSWPDGSVWAIEVTRSLSPKMERGFHAACADLHPTRKFVVYPGTERYRMAADIEAIPLATFAAELRTTSPSS